MFNRCRTCWEPVEEWRNVSLRCPKCKKEIKADFEWEWLKHWFDYYFRWYIKHKDVRKPNNDSPSKRGRIWLQNSLDLGRNG